MTDADKIWNDANMPDFHQDKIREFAKITIRFDSEDALNEFSELIGQKITSKTKSIWHPKLERGLHSKKRWANNSEE